MDDNRKEVEISNGAFDLKLHVNPGVLSSQVAIAIGAGALYLCSNVKTIRTLCGAAIIIDVMAVILYLIATTKHKDTEEGEAQQESMPAPSTAEAAPADVQHTKGNKSVKASTGTVRDKVKIPNPNAARTHGQHSASATATEPVVPEPMPIPQPEQTPAQVAPVEETTDSPAVSEEESSNNVENEWADFF